MKTKKILSVFIAMTMMLSMAVMCLPVIKASAAETTWTLGDAFKIGADGSTATLEDGPFSLHQREAALSDTVTTVNGVASIVSVDGKRAFSASADGIIDVTPAAGTRSRVVFTAPENGEYTFEVEVVQTAIPEGEKVKNWTEIGATESVNGGFNAQWGYKGTAIGNDANFTATSASHSAKVTLAAGQCIQLSVNAEGTSDETQLTVKKFIVKLGAEDKPAGTGGQTWTFGDAFKIGADGSTATLEDGPFSLHHNGYTLSDTVTTVNGVASIVNTEGTRAFSASADGIIDVTPAAGTRSRVVFTAPENGEYTFEIEVVKTAIPEGEKVKNWTEIGATETVSGRFNGQWGYKGTAVGNDANFTATSVSHYAKVTLTAGQCIQLSVNAEGTSNETQLTVKKFEVKLGGGAAHVCSKFTKATCQSPAICVECGEPDPNSQPDPSNHTSEAFADNGDGTHRVVYDCCGTVMIEAENHVYLPIGQCAQCGAKKPAETEPPVETTEAAEQDEENGPDMTVVIVIAVAAVVIVGGVVAAVVVAKKKKSK